MNFRIIFWYTDNYACTLITRKVGYKPKLHSIALRIHKISSMHNINLNVCCLPREEHKEFDRLSKQGGYGDRFIT